jgi:hypothetical protein
MIKTFCVVCLCPLVLFMVGPDLSLSSNVMCFPNLIGGLVTGNLTQCGMSGNMVIFCHIVVCTISIRFQLHSRICFPKICISGSMSSYQKPVTPHFDCLTRSHHTSNSMFSYRRYLLTYSV